MKEPKLSVPALIIIDVQEGFHDSYWGLRNNPQVEVAIEELLCHWRKLSWPIIHVKHLSIMKESPLREGADGCEFMRFARPLHGETVFEKSVNSAFIGTSLEEHLKKRKLRNLVMAGFTSDHCVSTSARMAANLGFKVFLSGDAVATFERVDYLTGEKIPAAEIHRAALSSLNGEFAEVLTQENLLKRFGMADYGINV